MTEFYSLDLLGAARLLLSGISLVWWLILLRVVTLRKKPVWALGPDAAAGNPEQLVSLLIPARNERSNIDACLDSVLDQDHPHLQILVMDDGSEDGTREQLLARAASEPRLQLVLGEGEPPEGWFGKAWALQRLQQQAEGEWLLFVDADVQLHPHAVSRVLGYAEREEAEWVSGLGNLVLESFWEQVLQPVVASLVLFAHDLDRINDPEHPAAMANGQFIFVRRALYDRLGQHTAVRGEVLDDVRMAEAAAAVQGAPRLLYMRKLFKTRMYRSLPDIWEGWSKNLFDGMKRSWLNVGIMISIISAFNLVCLLLLAWGLWAWDSQPELAREALSWSALTLFPLQASRWLMDRTYGMNRWFGLSHAPGQALLILLILHSAWLGTWGRVRWKGRAYAQGKAEPTRGG